MQRSVLVLLLAAFLFTGCGKSSQVDNEAIAAASEGYSYRESVEYELPTHSLPTWFTTNRVHGHTRFTPQMMGQPDFFKVAESMEGQGATVFTRHFKSGGEGAWWNSTIGGNLRKSGWNSPTESTKQMIQNAHERGLHVIAYYRHIEDRWATRAHPDWLCRSISGETVSTNRGKMLCLNSRYRSFLTSRIMELAELGVDGFYFDEWHMPMEGCWCDSCRTKFESSTGLDSRSIRNELSTNWVKHKGFTAATIRDAFESIDTRLKERYPDKVMIVSSAKWPTMADLHVESDLFRLMDVHKTEFSIAFRAIKGDAAFSLDVTKTPIDKKSHIARGFIMCRDAADGRPPHVWVHGLLDEKSAIAATGAVLTHGGIANLDVEEDQLNGDKLHASFELGRKISPYLKTARPVRHAAIHFSERRRNQFFGDSRGAWRKVLFPIHSAFQCLLENRVPVGFITDSQLEDGQLEGYRFLIVSDLDSMTKSMVTVINAFKERGGIVIELSPMNSISGQATNALAVKNPALLTDAPVIVHSECPTVQAGFYYEKSTRTLTVLCTDRYDWVFTGKSDQKGKIARAKRAQRGLVISNKKTDNIEIRLFDGAEPAKVIDVFSGDSLVFEKRDGVISVQMPSYQQLAAIAIQY